MGHENIIANGRNHVSQLLFRPLSKSRLSHEVFICSLRTISVGVLLAMCLLVGCGGGGSAKPTTPPAQNPAPSITSLSPSSSTAGAQPQTLTIQGANFLPSSTVTYN